MSAGYRRELFLLLLVAVLVLAAGLGLRDPWPADEPRFALIAKEMVEQGSWLLPRVGGILYPDKPPLFFWLVAGIYALTQSIRVAILVPGIVSGLGVLLLVTDLARRLWDERTAIYCGATMLALLQFPLQMKSGQIDGLLCLWTTLGLYGFARHLLPGPDWRWYTIGGVAAGLGIITKGVGFLPYLVFIPYLFAANRGWPVSTHGWRNIRWALAPAATLAVVLCWLVPMLIATGAGADLAAYRDEILFHQTVTRYADSWGHLRPPWYFLTNAIPWLWLPVSFLLPWLIPAWRRDLRDRNAAVLLFGAWTLLVIAFFSVSMGKRSLYIFPAAPALALVAGYHARALLSKAGVRRMLVAIPIGIGLLLAVGAMYALMNPHALADWTGHALTVAVTSLAMLATGLLMLVIVGIFRRKRVLTGYASSMLAFWLGLSLLAMPSLDAARSGRELMADLAARVSPGETVAFVDWPEQFLLQWDRPLVHFGFRRDNASEIADAADWLGRTPSGRVLVPSHLLGGCFDAGRAVRVGAAHRREWYLVDGDSITGACRTGPLRVALVVHYPAQASAGTGSRL